MSHVQLKAGSHKYARQSLTELATDIANLNASRVKALSNDRSVPSTITHEQFAGLTRFLQDETQMTPSRHSKLPLMPGRAQAKRAGLCAVGTSIDARRAKTPTQSGLGSRQPCRRPCPAWCSCVSRHRCCMVAVRATAHLHIYAVTETPAVARQSSKYMIWGRRMTKRMNSLASVSRHSRIGLCRIDQLQCRHCWARKSMPRRQV